MDGLNGLYVLGLLLLLLILAVLWIIKEEISASQETDPQILRSSRRFRYFEEKDYFFRKNHKKINQEMIKRLKSTYSVNRNMEDLREENLGIKILKKELSDDAMFTLTAILSLLISLFVDFSEMPLAIVIISALLILVGIISYLKEFFQKVKMEARTLSIILSLVPVIFTIGTVIVFVHIMAQGIDLTSVKEIDWLYELILIEAILLYLIQLYQKIKYINYLEIVSIVLNEMILEKDRKFWME